MQSTHNLCIRYRMLEQNAIMLTVFKKNATDQNIVAQEKQILKQHSFLHIKLPEHICE